MVEINYYVYIMANQTNVAIYTGVTNDLFALQDYVDAKNKLYSRTLSSDLSLYSCMAVNPHIIQINPDGNIGKCDHYIFDRLIGNIYSDKFDEQEILSWEGLKPPVPQCAECVHYPTCKEIIQCPDPINRTCDEIMRKDYTRTLERSIIRAYREYVEKNDKR